MNPAFFHESRFGARLHEARRDSAASHAHELRALRAAHELRPRSDAVQGRDGSQRSEAPTPRRHGLARHSRAAIHARHLARVQYERVLRTYRLEVRQWRQLLTERERLLRKLTRLERRERRLDAMKVNSGQRATDSSFRSE